MFVISKILLWRDNTQHPEAMQLFLWIGLLFVLIGVIKLVIAIKKKTSVAEEKIAEKLAGPEASLSAPEARDKARRAEQQRMRRQEMKEEGSQKPVIITCPACKTKNYSSSNFCHMCGQKLR